MDKLHNQLMKDWGYPNRARHILVIHGRQALTAFNGNGFKSWSKTISGRGYNTHTWQVDAMQCGASIHSNHLVTFCFPENSPHQLPSKLKVDTSIRPCRNLIRTYGIYPSQYQPTSLMEPSTHPTRPNWVGTLHGQPVYHWDDPFCS